MKHLSLEQIFEYIDNSSQKDEVRRIEVHLRECSVCRSEVELQKSLTKAIEHSVLIEPSSEFSLKLMKVLLNEPLPKSNRKFLILSLLQPQVLLVATILISVGIFIASIPQKQIIESKPSEIQTIVHSFSDLILSAGHFSTEFFITIATFLPFKSFGSFFLLLCSGILLWIADKMARKRFLNTN